MVSVLMGPPPVGVSDLLQQPGRVRAEGARQVEGGGQQRLQDAVADGRGLVLPGSVRHLGDDRGGGSSPGPQSRGDGVGGEQFPVGDQVGDGLGGGPAGCRAALAGHVPVAVEQVAAVGHPCLAPVVVDAGEGGDALAVQPVQEPGQLGEPGRTRSSGAAGSGRRGAGGRVLVLDRGIGPGASGWGGRGLTGRCVTAARAASCIYRSRCAHTGWPGAARLLPVRAGKPQDQGQGTGRAPGDRPRRGGPGPGQGTLRAGDRVRGPRSRGRREGRGHRPDHHHRGLPGCPCRRPRAGLSRTMGARDRERPAGGGRPGREPGCPDPPPSGGRSRRGGRWRRDR